ncbi:MAG: GNAT family N-acetyltransferase, partial [Bacteroidota bacterium]
VLKKYQRQGIGSLLMDEAERRIRAVSRFSGIGFGITPDYGPAQILYVKRGYIPDGNGLTKDGKPLNYLDKVVIHDDLVLYLIKELSPEVS